MELTTRVNKLAEKYVPKFEHTFNPLHVYCRLKSNKYTNKYARKIGCVYEKYIYENIIYGMKKYNGRGINSKYEETTQCQHKKKKNTT